MPPKLSVLRKQVSHYRIQQLLYKRDNLVTVVREVDHNHVKFKIPPCWVLSKITVWGRERRRQNFITFIMTTSVCQEQSLGGDLPCRVINLTFHSSSYLEPSSLIKDCLIQISSMLTASLLTNRRWKRKYICLQGREIGKLRKILKICRKLDI